ncbi:MAG: DUF2804 domain-containing protein [Spirochaetes bacterium]|nr:DUF2804 domain-containing protein [Spirochaetota bacterium]MBP8991971.1 DUF2804 domain-containing protein [Spirochaetota bacterium]HOV46678.1 DUF2804 domain-containing protein [Exilispira sp.]HQQ18561.1 DUF2804 domain-containing protein [Exilispira sp.]
MQNRITKKQPLLDEKGHITEPGWATYPLWEYKREKIKAPKWRIKEWDYYAIISEKKGYGLTFTISDLSYTGLIAICYLDFNHRYYNQIDEMIFFPSGNLKLSQSDNGVVSFTGKKLTLKFETIDDKRTISFSSRFIKDYDGNCGIEGEIILYEKAGSDRIAIATPWKENPRAFYYNQKVNCLSADGYFILGEDKFYFEKNEDFGVLDWGRGVWTYKNRWYWSSLSTKIDDHLFGWNLGYGFSDRTSATENALFYDGKISKLDDVKFIIDKSDYMKPWKIVDNQDRLNIDFLPQLNRKSKTDVVFIKSIQNQLFGSFNGYAILDDGKKVEIKDKIGFAEDVVNLW